MLSIGDPFQIKGHIQSEGTEKGIPWKSKVSQDINILYWYQTKGTLK